MKISAAETALIDRYLLGQLPAGDQLLFDAKLVLHPELRDTTEWQQQVHQLVKQRGRQQLKRQIATVEQQIFNAPQHRSFRQWVMALFG